LSELAQADNVLKASRRDLASAIALGKTAATTVASTMALAHAAGIRVFATGGIGGAHRDAAQPWDISADLIELARTPVVVVCAGAKSILDIPRTLEILETHGVPAIGWCTDTFPAFYQWSSGVPVSARVDTVTEAANLVKTHWALGGAGLVLAQPIAPEFELDAQMLANALVRAEIEAARAQVRGPALTPFLLARIAEETEGQSLDANRALVVANGRLAAQVAGALSTLPRDT
jgi:pseudouridine-5'-phosphate glycosidase